MRTLSKRIPVRGRGYSLAYQACGSLMCNMYTLICESTGETVIIDPSCTTTQEWDQVHSYLDNHHHSSDAPTVNHILLTHGHADHVAGVAYAMQEWPNASLYLHPLEEENYRLAPEHARHFGFQLPSHIMPSPTQELIDGEVIAVGESIRLRTVHTPGHCPGHVAFVDDRSVSSLKTTNKRGDDDVDFDDEHDNTTSSTNSTTHSRQEGGEDEDEGSVIVGGDLLFRGSVGRTDLFNSSIEDLYASLNRLYTMNHENSIVLSGHTTPTLLKTEHESNPYVQWALQLPPEYFEEAKQRHGWKM